MASNTENLNLLMKNPSTDGADTFNVQTMLNENWQKIDNNAGTVAQTLANILKPTTPPIIGLPPSTTPDGMFQALGNTGELHVWRKTVVVGSYYIGATQGNYGCICRNTGSASFGVKIQYASEITVDSHENRNLVSPSDMTIIANNSGITSPSATSVTNALKGKFIRLAGIPDGYQNSELKYAVGSVFYCPESISCFVKDAFNDGNHYICLDGIKNVPTKTENVVTYPVSTNPNAYQEGDDAKPAGYVVGEEKSVTINGMNGPILLTGDSLTVADDGTLSVTSPAQYGVYNSSTTEDVRSVVAGKYIYIPYNSGSVGFFKVPSDVIVTGSTAPAGGSVFAFTAQPVTGYAAIPAGTTIEYLGKLGDKVRAQLLSYVGTGTYGVDNPCSLTFDFAPKMVIIRKEDNDNAKFDWIIGMTSVGVHWDGNYVYIAAIDGKKLSFYNPADSFYQMNGKGSKYYAIAIG